MRSRLARFDDRVARRAAAQVVAGVDEVGRGCLAGPVVVAAVVLPRGIDLEGVRDSKELLPEEREEAYGRIRACAHTWAALAIHAPEVDRLNVLAASLVGMSRVLNRLSSSPDLVLVDGPYLPEELPAPGVALVKGDGRSLSIAAASIMAKVARDRLMRGWHRHYPGYGFETNFGYPTPEHRKALEQQGACPLHRRSFAPVKLATTVLQLPFDEAVS